MTASHARQRSEPATLDLFTCRQGLRHVSVAGCKDLLKANKIVELQEVSRNIPDLAHYSYNARSIATAQASL